jgi:hypothetical protein
VVEAAWLASLGLAPPPEGPRVNEEPAESKEYTQPAPPPSESRAAERQHEALKEEIAAEAECLDYTVFREKDIAPHGRPDLILERGTRRIACEISDTTHPETEADHIRLRLLASFTHVGVISANGRKLKLIEEAFLGLGVTAVTGTVGFYSPKEFIAQLFAWAADDPTGGAEERGKPRRQKFDLAAPQPMAAPREAAERQLLARLRRAMDRDRPK